MPTVVQDTSRLPIAIAASLVVHAAIAWATMDRTTVATLTEHGVTQVVAVQLRTAAPPAPPQPPVSRPAETVESAKPVPVTPIAPTAPPDRASEPRPAPDARPEAKRTPDPPPVAAAPRGIQESPATPAPIAPNETLATPAPIAPIDSIPTPAIAPLGVKADPLSAYVATVRDRILQQKRYPRMARKRGIEGRVEVRIRIDATGAIASIDCDGAAPRELARATLKAVQRAGPFPPPPQGEAVLLIPLEYGLNDV